MHDSIALADMHKTLKALDLQALKLEKTVNINVKNLKSVIMRFPAHVVLILDTFIDKMIREDLNGLFAWMNA